MPERRGGPGAHEDAHDDQGGQQRLVGREEALAAVRAALVAGASGHPSVVLILGEAGMGKSTLLDAALDGTTSVVMRSTGDEAERDLDYGVVEQLVRSAPVDDRVRAALLPPPGTDPLEAGARLLRTFDGLEFDASLVYVTDDAHLADAASMQALTFAARRLHQERITWLVAARPSELDGLPTGLRRLAERTGGVVVLEALDLAAVVDLSAIVHGRPLPRPAAVRVHGHTGGHPLHTRVLLEQLDRRELLDGDELPAPRTFTSLVMAQLATCPPPARRLLAALAVLRRAAEVHEVAAIAGVDEPLEAVDALCAAGLVEISRPPGRTLVRARHAMVLASVHHDLSTAERVRLHEAAAAVTSGDESVRHRLAANVAPDPELATDVAALAADAAASGAPRQAARHLRAAAAVSPDDRRRARWLLQAADHLLAAGQPLGDLAREVERLPPSGMRSATLGRVAVAEGRFADAAPLLRAAWEALRLDHAATPAAAVVAEHLAVLARSRLDVEELTAWAQRATAVGGGPMSTTLACHGLAMRGELRRAGQLAEEAVVTGHDELDAVLARGATALWSGDLDRATAHLTEVVRRGAERSLLMTVEATTALAEARLRAGDLDEAADLAETAAGLADDAEVVWLTPQPRAIAAAALAACGQEARARDHLAAARRVAMSGEQQPALLWCEHGALRVADALGDSDAVVSAGHRIVAAGWADVHETIAPWRASYVEALAGSGDGAATGADVAVQQLERAARDGDDATTATDAARARAALEVARGDDDAATRRFDDGLALDGAPARPWSRARLELAAGSFHRRAGRRSRATQLLDQAERRFAAMGARRWVDRTRRELEACGSRPSSRRTTDAPTTLTTQERVVARLVAGGRSNREVAAELFISVKTVEHHVSRVFAKLGVRSRTQLAARFAAGDADAARP